LNEYASLVDTEYEPFVVYHVEVKWTQTVCVCFDRYIS
jgi:hypothetical protein